MRELHLPPIIEEALRAHPFYMPLLEAKSLRNVTADFLDSWMGSARVYLRESVEDHGELLICLFPEAMDELFRMLQIVFVFWTYSRLTCGWILLLKSHQT
jgi:hypothetical protein